MLYFFSRLFRKAINCLFVWFLIFKVSILFFFYKYRKPQSHELHGELIVSLTSYPARYSTLHLTLKSILLQNMKPEKVILWIADEDYGLLPHKVLKLMKHGLMIVRTKDIKSYKKIVPVLHGFPDSYIITLDDDIYYPEKIVERLVSKSIEFPRCVIANRTHMIKLNQHRKVLPYLDWGLEKFDNDNAVFNFQTGVGGVLYPPRSLSVEVLNEKKFMRLAPNADDVWLYWMTQLNGNCVVNTGYQLECIAWPSTQKTALFLTNTAKNEINNDVQIERMIDYYGMPIGMQKVLCTEGG